jgi:hypothetical protein
MMVHLDATARETIRRFGLKVGLTALVASLGTTSYVLAASGWMALYAIVTAVMALLLGQQFQARSLNHWDEAMWLTTGSLGLWAVYKAWS